MARYRLRHPDRVKASQEKWKADHPEEFRASQRRNDAYQYAKAPEKSADKKLARAARLAGRRVEKISRTKIFERDGWVCQICMEPIDRTLKKPDLMRASIDHIQPISKGGHHTVDNVQASHLLCNLRKGNRS